MKRIGIVLVWVIGLVSVLVTGCRNDDDYIPVSGVSLSVSELVLKVGQDTVINATVTPQKASDASVIWYSDNPKVATVEEGKVHGVSSGKALITVETIEGEYTAFCVVTVVPSFIPAESIGLDRDSIILVIGCVDTLRVTVLPPNATNRKVTWTSSNNDVVTVSDGVITAVDFGNATVTASLVDSELKAECSVSVVEPYVTVLPLKVERLPDMINGRADHILFVADGHLTVAGGHVRNFARTKTAEYLQDGEWHSMMMNYNHDMAFSVVLKNGRMMLGGGCSSDYGVGVSQNVEIYDPVNHSFSVMPSMVKGRTLSHAVEIADGDVFVSGNWYNSDSKELYSSTANSFSGIGSVDEPRSTPYVLQSAADKAIVFGPTDNYGDKTTLIVDRMDGSNFSVKLFDSWTPYGLPVNWRSADCAIADYSYLILAGNENDEAAVIKVEGESFSLLETELPIPMTCDDDHIKYSGLIFTDKEHSTAYLPAYNGSNDAVVYYMLKIDYSESPARLSLYKTDTMDIYASVWSMTKLPDGRLVACGGIYDNNYTPYSTVLAFDPF